MPKHVKFPIIGDAPGEIQLALNEEKKVAVTYMVLSQKFS